LLSATDRISLLLNHFPYLGIFVLLILGGIGLPFPEDTTLILSGFLVAHRVMKPFPTFMLIYCGLLITDFLLYSVGRKYGRAVVEHKRFHRILSPDRLSQLEEKFRKRDGWVVFLGRHLLGLRAQIFLVSGVMRMSPARFLFYDAVSALFTILLMGGIGYLGGNSLRTLIERDATRIEHIAAFALAIMIALGFLLYYFTNPRRSTPDQLQDPLPNQSGVALEDPPQNHTKEANHERKQDG
jgi:membrane protein DedA with SNARE-associated domain